MKNLNLLMSLLMMSTLVLMSCDEEVVNDDCLSLEAITPADVTLSADTITLNEGVEIEIGINVGNGCGDYHSTIIEEDGNTVNLTAKAIYAGCICTQAIEYKTGTITYTPTSTGVKLLEYGQGVTDTLIVQ